MPEGAAAKIIGLVRDLLVAGFGVAILFGAPITDKQTVGIIALVAPIVALAAYVYSNVSSPKGGL